MFTVIWSYTVPSENRESFEANYRADGTWAKLFRRGDGYLGTDFYADRDRPEHFLTVDRWRSREHYDRFFEEFRSEYVELDTQCGELTEEEELLATLDT